MIKIFILEDEISMCDIYKEFFKTFENTYEVVTFTTIEEADKRIKETGIDYWDCFISDLNVPYNRKIENTTFNTFDFIEQYLEPCKTIVVSGYSSPEIKDHLRHLGVVSLFSKPIDLQLLLITINSIAKCCK
jgi:DNA-binding NtrC family response regulator